ncbi:CDGSH iron-sulfur domain-containing protein 1-like [Bolinopsis microptera]|uniref:CDGSH iron-sulfur domain-containing protein 1-like n=1 Tax=Bolinopsis microptera TaxID=2820187 RepID=UPI00307AF2D5
MSDLLGKLDLTAAGVCLASTIFGVAVGYIWSTRSSGKQCCNTTIKKDCDKVVDVVDMEDLGAKTCYCRCWQSKKFPLCDGAHNAHNARTGDNLGPLVVKKSE